MEPMIEIAGARVFLGDCVEVMKSLPDNSVDSVVTDPPYGLEFMGKEWDAPWKKSGSFNGNIEETAESAGGVSKFANHRVRYQKGLAPMLGFQLWATEWAVECLRVLKPGGHILAFGGSRTWHRLAVAVEDAGFELRDSIAWIYGSGFPKSLDISKAIEKKAGVEPVGAIENEGGGFYGENYGWNPTPRQLIMPETQTAEGKQWQGWGTALKPAFEPVVVGRKPLVGTVAENVLLWGVGGLNIDGSRIGAQGGTKIAEDDIAISRESKSVNAYGNGIQGPFGKPVEGLGRWPANVILDEVSAGLLDEQSGVLKSGANKPYISKHDPSQSVASMIQGNKPGETLRNYSAPASEGGASRFFYVAKASKRDRNEGLEELEGASSGGKGNGLARVCETCGASILKPCDCPERSFVNPAVKNFHPTVKPTQLMRYLIKLVTPAGGTVLDPFTGSGSTGKAALLDGYQFIGAELTEEYLPIIEGRLRWASEQKGEDDGKLF